MKKQYLLGLALLSFLFFVQAHETTSPTVEWQKSYGDDWSVTPNSLKTTFDGGCILAGHQLNAKGDTRTEDLWVMKTNSSGDALWEYAMGDLESESARSIIETEQGNFVLIGTNKSKGLGKGDIWVVCLNSKGVLLWDKTYGSALPDEGASIIQTQDGNLVALGTRYTDNKLSAVAKPQQAVWLAKLNPNTGEPIWEKTFANQDYNTAQSVLELAGGSLAIIANTIVKDKSTDGWVIKTNSYGDQLWSRLVGGKKLNSFKNATVTHDGSIVAVGNSFDKSITGDAWIVKIATTGDILWEKTLEGSDYETAEVIQQTNDGALQVVTNITNRQAQTNMYMLSSLDEKGNENWLRLYADNSIEKITAAAITPYNDLLLVGMAPRSLAPCYQTKAQKSAWLVKMHQETDTQWAPYAHWDKTQK